MNDYKVSRVQPRTANIFLFNPAQCTCAECEKYPRAQLMNSLADPAAVCKSLSHLLRELKIQQLQPKLRELDKLKCAAAQHTLSAQILDEAIQVITSQNFEFSNQRILHFNYHIAHPETLELQLRKKVFPIYT